MSNQKIFLPEELITKVLSRQVKTIFLLGGSDTGKTSLCEYLIELLRDNFSLGIVDSDMGQSHIGSPTTVAWAKIKEEFTPTPKSLVWGCTFWQDLEVEDFFFVGTLSPAGNTSRVLEAVEFVFRKAKVACDKVIIDTTGYIQGFEAVDFKIKKIRLLEPDLVICLKKEDELELILKQIESDRSFIFKMDVPGGVRQKSNSERALYRENLFKDYFFEGSEVLIDASIFKRWDNPDEELVNKLVSLRNSNNKDLALGVIKRQEDKNIWILTPFKETEKVTSVIVGNCKWQD